MNVDVDISNLVIETDRLVLRPFKMEDLEDFYEYAKVPGLGEMAGWPHHESIRISKNILENFIDQKKVLALEKDGKVIGSLGIEKYDNLLFPELEKERAREIGFVLSKDYWGEGLMPEAAGAVLKYLFNELKLDLVLCSYYEFNGQSKRVQEKLGFKTYKKYTMSYLDREEAITTNILRREDYLKAQKGK